MSEVRPIDANVLIKIVNNEKAPDWWKEIINGWIQKQPTMDAVPVEFIKSYIRREKDAVSYPRNRGAVAVQEMLNEWLEGDGRLE